MGKCTQLVLSPQSFMTSPISTMLAPPSDPLYPGGIQIHIFRHCWKRVVFWSSPLPPQLHMGWQRNWQTSSAPWLCAAHTTGKTGTRWGHYIIQCKRPFHISFNGPFHTNSSTKITTGPHITPKDQHVHSTNCHVAGVLSKNTYFLFQDKYYEQVHGAAMGSPISPLIASLLME